MDVSLFDQRPIIVALAGSNGAGKTTFYHSHLSQTGLRYINADDLAAELKIDAYAAAELAAQLRLAFIAKRESFIFETVLSDPIGDKVRLLQAVAADGYQVVLIFIQIADSETSIQRVSMRFAQGGHDVPDDKLRSRFSRTRQNLERAIVSLPHVIVFDNSDLASPYQPAAVYQNGKRLD